MQPLKLRQSVAASNARRRCFQAKTHARKQRNHNGVRGNPARTKTESINKTATKNISRLIKNESAQQTQRLESHHLRGDSTNTQLLFFPVRAPDGSSSDP